MDCKKYERIKHEAEVRKLKMSLVPLPCQESQLPKDCSSTQSESLEWLIDLADKFNVPIWSRRLTLNTSGIQRNLPMSMVKNFHVEIKNRLWSLWGNIRKCKPGPCNRCCKPFLGVLVIGLCAARIYRFGLWHPLLIDEIQRSGEKYFRQSFKNCNLRKIEFDLADLSNDCYLQGLKFRIFFKTVEEGYLYSTPLDGRNNLSFALLNFFKSHQFGILECFNRYLGFGFNQNVKGGYFMFDAQSMNYPIFCKNRCAPFLLRTNHLQILVYCLTVALDVPHLHAPFALHSVNITIVNDIVKLLKDVKPVSTCQTSKKRILPKEYWNTSSEYSESDLLEQIKCGKEIQFIKPIERENKLVRRLRPTQIDECLGEFKVMPLVEVKPNLKKENDKENDISDKVEHKKTTKDFVRMICSSTEVPYTPAEEAAKISNSFVGDLTTILATGCATKIQCNIKESPVMKRFRKGRKPCQ